MLSSVAAQRQESVRFALVGPIPRKTTPVEGLCWPRSGGHRVGYRPLGGVPAPTARARGTRISQTAPGGFMVNSGSEPVRGKSVGPASGTSPAAGGWLEFSLDGEPLRAVGVSTDEAAHDVAQEYVDTGQGDRDTL